MNEADLAAPCLGSRVTVLQDGVHVRARVSTLAAAGSFAVLTAWNPGHRRPSPERNRDVNDELRRAADCAPDSNVTAR